MSINRHLFFYNTISVFTALVVMLLVSGVTTHFTAENYRRQSVASMDVTATIEVQELLQGEEIIRKDWPALDHQLRTRGYALTVTTQEGDPVFSSLDPAQDRLYHEVGQEANWVEATPITIQSADMVMVGTISDNYSVVSVSTPAMPMFLGSKRPPAEIAVLSMVLSGMAAIVVIVALNLLFTRRQVRRLLAPVDALARAARRVEEGDFSQPVDYGGQDEFSSVCTAFNQMQEHLLAEREKSAAYERARTDLVSGISHDLRTPLTSVKGYIKGLRDGVAQTPERQLQYLDIAYRKACDMDILLQRLFDFSRLETGNLPLFPEPADLGDFVSHFVQEAGQELEQEGGRVDLHMIPAAHPVSMDSEQIYRVLNNLKDNALRYAGANPLILTLTVWRQGDMECVRFADNGHGVAQECLPRLFERFWREDQARSSQNGEGSGLGLYIAKCIIEAHGGTIRVKNDGGLVFEIALPRREDDCHG